MTRLEAQPGVAWCITNLRYMANAAPTTENETMILAKIRILTAVKSKKTEIALIPCKISEVKFILDFPANLTPLSKGTESKGNFERITPPG